MKVEVEILINQYGQDIISVERILQLFRKNDPEKQALLLTHLVDLIVQSKPQNEDIEVAVAESKLKPTFTPCILLKKGIEPYNLIKIINLPKDEQEKVLVLLLNLFKIAYKRRYILEKNNPNKWWYWDLSDNKIIDAIKINNIR